MKCFEVINQFNKSMSVMSIWHPTLKATLSHFVEDSTALSLLLIISTTLSQTFSGPTPPSETKLSGILNRRSISSASSLKHSAF